MLEFLRSSFSHCVSEEAKHIAGSLLPAADMVSDVAEKAMPVIKARKAMKAMKPQTQADPAHTRRPPARGSGYALRESIVAIPGR